MIRYQWWVSLKLKKCTEQIWLLSKWLFRQTFLRTIFLWHLSIAIFPSLFRWKKIVLQSIDDFHFLESKMQQKWKLIDEMPAFEIKWSREHVKEMIIIIDSCDHMFPTSFFFKCNLVWRALYNAHSQFVLLFIPFLFAIRHNVCKLKYFCLITRIREHFHNRVNRFAHFDVINSMTIAYFLSKSQKPLM